MTQLNTLRDAQAVAFIDLILTSGNRPGGKKVSKAGKGNNHKTGET